MEYWRLFMCFALAARWMTCIYLHAWYYCFVLLFRHLIFCFVVMWCQAFFSSFHSVGLLCFSQWIVQFSSSSLGLASWKMALLFLLAPARMTFHPGSMAVVVPGLSGHHQLEKSDPGAAPANPVVLARGQEGKKAYCQKSQVKTTVTVLERIDSLGTFGDWRRLDHIVLFIALIARSAQPQFISIRI